MIYLCPRCHKKIKTETWVCCPLCLKQKHWVELQIPIDVEFKEVNNQSKHCDSYERQCLEDNENE